MALGHRDQADADLLRRDSALRLAVSESAGMTPLDRSIRSAVSRRSRRKLSRLIDAVDPDQPGPSSCTPDRRRGHEAARSRATCYAAT
jgi:hypothetical protein